MIRHLTIPRGELTLAADLHLPEHFEELGSLPAIVLATPGSSVKEQVGANYAAGLARRGFAALTFDPAYQGQSTGEPRDLEDPYQRSEDISYAIDALTMVPGIDAGRIGALGICAGGGYAVYTTRTDHRIRALGTIVATNMGMVWRSAAFSPDGPAAALDALAVSRRHDLEADRETRVQWLPDSLEDAEDLGATDIDTIQAITYYRTSRGSNPHSTNRRLLRSDALLTGFDAFHLVPELLTQPVQVIIAGRKGNTGQYEAGQRLAELAPNAATPMIIEGAGHYEMYDEPRYIEQAIEQLTTFYNRHL